MKKPSPRADHLRRALAQEAARVMSEHGVRDFLFAKRKAAERIVQQPALRLEVDDQPVEIAVFPLDGIRQSPVSPVDGKPMRRADAAEVAALIEAG